MTTYFSDEVASTEQPTLTMGVQSAPPGLQVDIPAWERDQHMIDEFIQSHFQQDVDFYILKDKQGKPRPPSLGKAGAEKLAKLLHLRASFSEDAPTRAMLGNEPGLVCYLCDLYTKEGVLFAEGRGASHANSDPGNPNKTIKMAQKSAQIDAILRGLALSGRYTQDMEDQTSEVVTGQKVPDMTGAPKPRQAQTPTTKSQEEVPFLASELRQREYNGKTYWNVFGDDLPKQYSKFGIPLWPDAAAASSINLDDPPDIQGWEVRWSLREYQGTMRPRVDLLVDPGADGAGESESDDIPF